MNCAECGKEQDGKTSYCRQCGHRVKPMTAKQRTARAVGQGLGLVLIGFVLVSIFAILRDLDLVPQVYTKVAAAVFCIGGVIRMCWPWVAGYADAPSEEGAGLIFDAATNTFQAPVTRKLPPERGVPITSFPAKRYETADLADAPSVTENTTKLLDHR